MDDMDRLRQSNGTCISVYGCNTFFANQAAGLSAWTNSGKSGYNGLQLVLRRPVSNGWGFDFNYTLSHSIDNVSGAESDTTGTGVQDAFNPDGYRGPSTFDIRHNVTANAVIELPFGHNKHFLKTMPRWADAILGGWQVSLLGTLRTGTPANISNAGLYPTNYLSAAIGILRPGATMPNNHMFADEKVLDTITHLAPPWTSFAVPNLAVPLLMALSLFIAVVQTFVFILLSQLYLSEVSHPPHNSHAHVEDDGMEIVAPVLT